MKRYACIACDVHAAKQNELVECDETSAPANAPDWCPLRKAPEHSRSWTGWLIPLFLLVFTLVFAADYRAYRGTVGVLPVGGADSEYVRGWGYIPFAWNGRIAGVIAFSQSGRTGGISLTLDGESYTSDREVGNQFEVRSSSGNTVLRGELTVIRYGTLETVPFVTGKQQVDYLITSPMVLAAFQENGIEQTTDEHLFIIQSHTAFALKDWVEKELAKGGSFWDIRDIMAVSAYCQQHPQWKDVTVPRNTGRIIDPLAILEYEVFDKDGNFLAAYIRPVRKATWTFCRDTWNWHL